MTDHEHNGAELDIVAQTPVEQVTPEQAELYRNAILAAMPGLTGAIDQALREEMGHPVAFVLITFGKGGSAFTSNISDSDMMKKALHDTVVGMIGEAA